MDILVLIALWFFVGASGFIYWWTKDYDLTLAALPLVFGTALLGPLAWIVGWTIHADHSGGSQIILKRRRAKP